MLKQAYSLITPWTRANNIQRYKNKVLSKIVSFFYMGLCCFFSKKSDDSEKKDVIISLTSFPARMKGLYYCLWSLLNQEYRPKKILLWLAKEQFPNGMNDVPNRIKKLQKYGLEILFCEDIRSYKKIVFTAEKYAKENIVIVDDDTLYSEDWMKRLWNEHLLFPENIICYRAHQIVVEDNQVLPYDKWRKLAPGEKGPLMSLMPVGVGGVLYPKDCFQNVKWNLEDIRKLAPTADDIWLKCLMINRGYKVVKVDIDSREFFSVLGTQKERLSRINVEQNNMNDVAMNNCIRYFGLEKNLKEMEAELLSDKE